MRTGINFYAKSYGLIEVPRKFSLDNLVGVHVAKSYFNKTVKLLDRCGYEGVSVSELK